MSEEKGGSKTNWVILVIIGVVLVLAVAGFFTWRYYQAKKVEDIANQIMANPDAFKNGTSKTSSTTGKIDQNLVGTWDTGCLVPDSNSPWSERHQFIIRADGTATHTRWSGDDHNCSPTMTLTDNYILNFPGNNQINLVSAEAKGTMYDIYQVSGSTLLFGHGFCNCSIAGSVDGGATAGGRFTRLNEFLKYQKK